MHIVPESYFLVSCLTTLAPLFLWLCLYVSFFSSSRFLCVPLSFFYFLCRPQVESDSDYVVIRPIEVLFEEWANLRKQGINTPKISVWPCSPANSTMWQYFLDNIYNIGTYDDLIYMQDGKKVVFVPQTTQCYDPSVEAAIASNGGRNDIKVIRMWALFGKPTFDAGTWGFFSPCTAGSDPTRFTTSMVGEPACNQNPTLGPDGRPMELTASGSYMLSQCALPFAAPGHMRGLTLQRLFQRVLDQHLPHLFVSSFNEHVCDRKDRNRVVAGISSSLCLPCLHRSTIGFSFAIDWWAAGTCL